MQLLLLSTSAALLVAAAVMAFDEVAGLYRAATSGQQALVRASAGLSGGALERAATGDLDLEGSCAELAAAAAAFDEAIARVQRLGTALQVVQMAPGGGARAESY